MVTARGKRRMELRAAVFDFAHCRCEWPQCGERATELAHITSSGMGGSEHRDHFDNVFAACEKHARISDGLPPPGGTYQDRNDEYAKVPGATGPGGSMWRTRDVTEALRAYLKESRGE